MDARGPQNDLEQQIIFLNINLFISSSFMLSDSEEYGEHGEDLPIFYLSNRRRGKIWMVYESTPHC